jgi:5-oxoprolinase (ATP-hydrolysing)
VRLRDHFWVPRLSVHWEPIQKRCIIFLKNNPKIFDLNIFKPPVLYEEVVEVKERVKLLSKFEVEKTNQKMMSLEEYRDSLNQEVSRFLSSTSTVADEERSVLNLEGPLLKLGESSFVRVLQKPNLSKIKTLLESIKRKGLESIGICLMHSYIFDVHEMVIFRIAEHLGFRNISCSSKIFPKVNFVRRGNATLLDAYLNPIISDYLQRFLSGFSKSDQISIPVTQVNL